MPLLTVSQLSVLSAYFARAEANTIPASFLVDRSLTNLKIQLGSITFAEVDASEFATFSQGASADTAFSWGDHASEGYYNAGNPPPATPYLRKVMVTAAGGEVSITLATTPVGVVQVFYKASASLVPAALWTEGTDYTVAGDVITYVSTTPLVTGDEIHVYWTA